MEYPSGLCLIDGPSSLQSFGRGCTKPWIPVWTLVLHITLRSMGRLREWIRSLRICWELVLCSTEWVGIRVYRTLTFLTTIATKRVLRWHRLRCYIVVAVEPHCFGMRPENDKFLDPTYYMMLRDKSGWWERTWGLRSWGRRVMPIIGEENWVSRLEVMCTSRCHLWEDYDVSMYEASSHLGSLVRSRSWRREVK
jgi:hypothetical protein